MPLPTFSSHVAKAIIAVQRDIGKISKEGFNSFQRYKYVKWETICERLSPLLAEHGLLLHQSETGREIVERSANGSVLAINYEFTVIHADSGECWPPIRWTALSRLVDGKGTIDDKAAAKCHTQAEKYASIKLFKIVVDDAIDSDADDVARRAPAPPPPRENSISRRAQPKPTQPHWEPGFDQTSMSPAEIRQRMIEPLNDAAKDVLVDQASEAACKGSKALSEFWRSLDDNERLFLTNDDGLTKELRAAAVQADAKEDPLGQPQA